LDDERGSSWVIGSGLSHFNGKFRDECLDLHWSTDLADAKEMIESWRAEYIRIRPRSSLGNTTPEAFA